MFISELLKDVEVYPYTEETAFLAGRLAGEQQSRGITIPFVDLLIGATAPDAQLLDNDRESPPFPAGAWSLAA